MKWSKKDISTALKLILSSVLLIAIAVIANETWTTPAEHERKLHVFEIKYLRIVLGLTLQDQEMRISERSLI